MIRREEIIGDCRLLLGDCLDILPTLGKVDAIVTDPPYMFSVASAGAGKLHPWADICNAAFWYAELFRLYRRKLIGDGVVWQFCNWRTLPTLQKAAFDADWKIESLAVWDKKWIGPGGARGLRPRYELIALLVDGEGISDRGISDIFEEQASSAKPSGHPAEKPIGIMAQIINISPGSMILDPFMGSGTTGVACVNLGRKFMGIEIEEKYFDIACKRVEEAYKQPRLFTESGSPPTQEAMAF